MALLFYDQSERKRGKKLHRQIPQVAQSNGAMRAAIQRRKRTGYVMSGAKALALRNSR